MVKKNLAELLVDTLVAAGVGRRRSVHTTDGSKGNGSRCANHAEKSASDWKCPIHEQR